MTLAHRRFALGIALVAIVAVVLGAYQVDQQYARMLGAMGGVILAMSVFQWGID